MLPQCGKSAEVLQELDPVEKKREISVSTRAVAGLLLSRTTHCFCPSLSFLELKDAAEADVFILLLSFLALLDLVVMFGGKGSELAVTLRARLSLLSFVLEDYGP